MKIAAVGKAFPPHYYPQDELLEAFSRVWSSKISNQTRLESLHRNVLVGGRHLALPLEEYETLGGWGKANAAWMRVGVEVGERAVRDALVQSGLSAADVDSLIFVSVTGIATRASPPPSSVSSPHNALVSTFVKPKVQHFWPF